MINPLHVRKTKGEQVHCIYCGVLLASGAAFCQRCGREVQRPDVEFESPNAEPAASPASGMRSSVIGDSNSTFQAGRDMHVTSGEVRPKAVYDVTSYRSTPLTARRLDVLSTLSGIATLALLAVDLIPIVTGGSAPWAYRGWFLIGAMVASVVLIALVRLRSLVRHQTQRLFSSPLAPAIVGWEGRIGLARFAGTCPTCGGKLRFYNKAIEWVTDQASGRRKVTKSAMAAECVRNSDHWWTIDSTDGGRDGR